MRDFAEAVGSHTNLWKSKSIEEKRDCRMAQRPQKKLDALKGKREISTFGRAYQFPKCAKVCQSFEAGDVLENENI